MSIFYLHILKLSTPIKMLPLYFSPSDEYVLLYRKIIFASIKNRVKKIWFSFEKYYQRCYLSSSLVYAPGVCVREKGMNANIIYIWKPFIALQSRRCNSNVWIHVPCCQRIQRLNDLMQDRTCITLHYYFTLPCGYLYIHTVWLLIHELHFRTKQIKQLLTVVWKIVYSKLNVSPLH